MRKLTQETYNVRIWDYLLILGWVLSPMTGFRIAKVGPGEILCLLWALRFLKSIKLDIMLLKFWFMFMVASLVGTAYCLFAYPHESTGFGGYFTWVYLMVISLLVYNGLAKYDLDYIYALLKKICMLSSVWYFMLYLYSVFKSSYFLGTPLWYARTKFIGGATNPNQFASAMLGIVVMLVFLFFRTHCSKKDRFFMMACLIMSIYTTLLTKSSTAVLSLVACGTALVVIRIINIDQPKKRIRILAVLVLFLLCSFLFYKRIYILAYHWIASDANGLGRLELFSHISDTFKKSPIFGLGAGIHSFIEETNINMEYHNTYLEILAMSGLVGFVSYVVFLIGLLKKTAVDIYLWLPIITYSAFGLSGFGTRRLSFWLIISFLVVIANNLRKHSANIKTARHNAVPKLSL